MFLTSKTELTYKEERKVETVQYTTPGVSFFDFGCRLSVSL